ncbi:transposase [Fusibacter paucivorans]|uniref:Transposase n=1 Tax=Fusibacter paucivorans TaxID=76009 RepID=A0ABS5PUN6_9FIRM|nr:transposase [Fusibacter paucivorans]
MFLAFNASVSIILSKIGDISRFHSKKQLIAYAATAGISNRSTEPSNKVLRDYYDHLVDVEILNA